MTGTRADDDEDDLPGAPFAPSVVAEMLRAFGKGMEEYDSTLYFLDDAEIDYLQTEIRRISPPTCARV